MSYYDDPNWKFTRYRYDTDVTDFLRKIKESGGFPGQVSDSMKEKTIPFYAEVEVSPHTGLIIQWRLTKNGKEALKWANYNLRHPDKYTYNPRYREPDEHAVRPLTIEVLDALKSILDTGEPGTEKLDIIARIQRAGGGGYYMKEWIADGPWATFKDGKWELTTLGKEAAVAHIRKAECAQFTGKVR